MKLIDLYEIELYKDYYLSRPVFLKSGAILVREKQKITEKIIAHLKNHKIKFVFVSEVQEIVYTDSFILTDAAFFELVDTFMKLFKKKFAIEEDSVYAMRQNDLREFVSSTLDYGALLKLYRLISQTVEYFRKSDLGQPLIMPYIIGEISIYLKPIYTLFLFLYGIFKSNPIYKKTLPNNEREQEFKKLCLSILLQDISLWFCEKPEHHEMTSAHILKAIAVENKPFFNQRILELVTGHHISMDTASFSTSNIQYILSISSDIVENKFAADNIMDYYKRIIISSFKFPPSVFVNVMKSMNIYLAGEKIYVKRIEEIEKSHLVISYDWAIVVGSSHNFLRPKVSFKSEYVNLNRKSLKESLIYIKINDKFYDVQENIEKFFDYLEYGTSGFSSIEQRKFSKSYIIFLQRLQDVRKQIAQQENTITSVAKNFIENLEKIKLETEAQTNRKKMIKRLKLYVNGKKYGEYENISGDPTEGNIEEII